MVIRGVYLCTDESQVLVAVCEESWFYMVSLRGDVDSVETEQASGFFVSQEHSFGVWHQFSAFCGVSDPTF